MKKYLNPTFALCFVALLLALQTFVFEGRPLLAVAVALIAIAAILPRK